MSSEKEVKKLKDKVKELEEALEKVREEKKAIEREKEKIKKEFDEFKAKHAMAVVNLQKAMKIKAYSKKKHLPLGAPKRS